MYSITATDFARNFRSVLDRVLMRRQTIVVRRNNQDVALLVPAATQMTALEALGDLYNIVPVSVAKDWLSQRPEQTVEELTDPWNKADSAH